MAQFPKVTRGETKGTETLRRAGRFLTSSWVVFAGLVLGLYLGVSHKEFARAIAPIGALYLSLLKMCLLPFLVSAVSVSLSRILRTDAARSLLTRLLAVFAAGLLLCGLLGVTIGLAISPGSDLDASSRTRLGTMVDRSPYATDLEIFLFGSTPPVEVEGGFHKIVMQVVPDNIFGALASGDNLKVLFFAIVFGAAIGVISRGRSDSLTTTLETVYHACQRVIVWINYTLPVALCALVASQIARVGIEPLAAMGSFLAAFSLAAVILLVLSSLVIWSRVRVRMGYFQSLMALREPVLIAAGTRSSVACIPSIIESMTERLGFNKTMVELVAPLGITLCRYGPTLYYAVATIFVAGLYEIPVTPEAWLLIFVGALLAGLASAGTSGILTITLLGLVLEPLGLPLEAALVLFIAIDPLADIIRTVAIVYPNCAAVAAVCAFEDEGVTDHPTELVEDWDVTGSGRAA